jgi:hypothetical protein
MFLCVKKNENIMRNFVLVFQFDIIKIYRTVMVGYEWFYRFNFVFLTSFELKGL